MLKDTAVGDCRNVDKQAELQTLKESEFEHQGGEDQHDDVSDKLETSESSAQAQELIASVISKRANARVPPQRYGFEDVMTYAFQVAEEVDAGEPQSYREAVSCGEAAQWFATMGMRWNLMIRIKLGTWLNDHGEGRLLQKKNESTRRRKE
ncbi:unnamed protein product [Linum trigynum]|uniref:Uncharacterized protein n=1 Tax=Linum trigynum TaxID=586398 RepID=A0AAV2DT26_9ROSI